MSHLESTTAANEYKSLSQLESVDRMMKLPVVETAWIQGQDVYGKVKNSNGLFNWALTTTEVAIQRTAAMAAPLVQKFDGPIQLVDQTLVKGIDRLETTAPIIKEKPQKIYEQTKTKVMETVQPHLDRMYAIRVAGQETVSTIKDLSVQKANVVLSTPYGSMAVNGVDSTSALAEKILDFCFPAAVNEDESTRDDAPISVDENPLLHTIQIVGRLSNKISRRVYNAVVRQINQLRKQDVQDYVNALIAILRLTQYLNLLQQKEKPAVAGEDREKK